MFNFYIMKYDRNNSSKRIEMNKLETCDYTTALLIASVMYGLDFKQYLFWQKIED